MPRASGAEMRTGLKHFLLSAPTARETSKSENKEEKEKEKESGPVAMYRVKRG